MLVVRECLVPLISGFSSPILVILDLLICPLAVLFGPDSTSREMSPGWGLPLDDLVGPVSWLAIAAATVLWDSVLSEFGNVVATAEVCS